MTDILQERALLVLSDGSFYEGEAFGAGGESIGEVVFNTSMSGYQEIVTDPSYRGQLVTMTMPHIGNYGVNELDAESIGVQVAGLIVREASTRASNWRATGTLHEYLVEHGTVAITGVDTRALTRRIRDAGVVMGAIAHGAGPEDVDDIVARIHAAPGYGEIDYVAACSVPEPRRVMLSPSGDRYVPHRVRLAPTTEAWPDEQGDWPAVTVVDFGVKLSILRRLAASGLRVTVVPHDSTADQVMATSPDGVLLSNGPGDPGTMDEAVARIRDLLGRRPVFGICLGHQLLGRAIGGRTFKLPFGHRGPNQPVMDVDAQRVQITSQNHGYALELDDVSHEVRVTHVNLNDRTIEGISIPALKAWSVQHHPEAGPGPHDAVGMFDAFRASLAG